MKYIFAIVFCINLYAICFCERAYDNYRTTNQRVQQYSPGNNLEWSGYSHSIDEGTCGGSKLVDEEVQKEGSPNTFKKTTYTWTGRGMFYITCVRVLNRMGRNSDAAEGRISDGGVGGDHVRIEMRSKDSQRIHFHVEIWGKPTRAQESNMAILTHTPNANSVLHMNGKKYCECN